MAEDDDDAQKTEEPSERKLSRAREKGQVPMSQEVKTWVVLIGAALAFMMLLPGLMGGIRSTVRKFIEEPHAVPMDTGHVYGMFGEVAFNVFLAMWPLFLLLIVLALGASIGQVGLMWAPDKITPKFEKISLIKGLKRMFSTRSLVEFAKGIAKIVVVAIVSFGLALPLLKDITLFPYMDPLIVLDRLHEVVLWMVAATVGVMAAIAALDFMYQKMMFTKQMRMTKQETKDEHKQAEGDPQIKAKIRSLRMARSRQRMMSAVPQADVVITNPTHYAVALVYKMEEMTAPRLVAKGVDSVALRIRQVAEDNEVPVVENPPLARALYASVELEEEIPPEHYKAVAEIIGYVMRLRGKLPGGTERLN